MTGERPVAARTPTSGNPAGRDVWLAWVSMLLLPVAFILAFVAGFYGYFLVAEVLLPLLGRQPAADGDMPLWAQALSLLLPSAVFAVPALLSTRFARRAAAAGDRRGWVPAALLNVLAVAFVIVNAVLLER
jgi:hypothetical protein